ncbi:chemotaxis protein CheA [Cyanobacteria bacterium FACHB-DQ100]|nr:chemotaxis protein CheA [Cyanobacteria bacterium FACHB-DQ100]
MQPLNEIDAEDLKVFLVESHEILAQFEQDVLHLENSSLDPALLHRMYRALHTIKGNCGFIPFPKLEAIAHAGEALLDKIRTAQRRISPEIATVLLQLTDVIRQILRTIEITKTEGNQDYSSLIATLTALCAVDAAIDGINPRESLEDAEAKALTPFNSTIRVQIDLLDHLMNLMGELVLARNRMLQLTATSSDAALVSTCQQINLITNELQDQVMQTRMQSLHTLWRTLPRFVRDLAIACSKEVTLVLEGDETELDRSLVAAIKDPLTHLIRNCIDHGIELSTARLAAGKSAAGMLKLRAAQESGKVILEISDDGAGIDPQQIKVRSQQLGLISATEAELISDQEALALIFQPGFSTATEVTRLSGRGVGLDVVRRNIEAVKGTVEVESQLGQGTTFRLKIPLTLAIIPTLLVKSGGERFAIPQASIQELVRIEGKEQIDRSIETVLNAPVYRLRGQILPLVNLASVLQLSTTTTDVVYFVVITVDRYHYGLLVDEIEDTQDIVIKPLSKQLKSLEMFAGATVLGDGTAALILDAAGLARYAGVQKQIPISTAVSESEQRDRQLILIVLGTENTRMGIVLTQATRLETISRTRIEQVGQQLLMQYSDRVVALIDLQAVFTGKPRSLNQFEESIPIVVITLDQNRTVGLMVNQILDIVEESLTVTGAAIRPGAHCYATVQGQITEILDLDAIVELANPYRVPELTTRR